MTPARRELERRYLLTVRQKQLENALRANLFALQLAFILDTAKRITNDTGRRGGKTHAVARRITRAANSGKRCLIVSLSKPHAIELYWSELTKLCEALKLDVKVDNVRHVIHFSSGGLIALGGVSTKDEREKCRGKGWHEVVCDETGSFGIFLQYFLEDVLDATLADYDGTLILAGTPSPSGAGYFHDVCHSDAWSHHHWTVLDNEMLPQWAGKAEWRELAEAFIAEKKTKLYPAKFEREYLGKWVRDLSALLVHFDEAKNRYDALPGGGYQYVMGIDTGSSDKSAIIVLAVSKATSGIYLIDEWQKAGVLIDGLVEQIRRMAAGRAGIRMVIDPANKQLVDSMAMLYKLPLEKADKLGKSAHIDIMNGASHQGVLRLPHKSATWDQACALEWNDDRTREREGQACDLFDAMLYAFWAAHLENYWRPTVEPEKPIKPQIVMEMERLRIEEQSKKKTDAEQKRMWGTDTLDFGTEPLDF